MERPISPLFDNTLKNFNVAVKLYLRCHDETSINAVLCSLQVLGQPSDQFVFNSKNTSIQEFYINLYELMSNINDESVLMWAAITVLQSVVKQGLFQNSILNNYKFTLILTKLLKDQLSLERRIKILKILQELTYGVKLQWQEGCLSELIQQLVKWISSEDKDLISLSLGVLINVCHKNKYAMFILVKCTHSKSFMRLLLKLQSNDVFIKIQIYKLLLVLEQVSGQTPCININNLIDVTFIVLEEGLKLKNLFVLRHAVDFFVDISEDIRWKNHVLDYSNYKPKLTGILETISNFKPAEKSHNNYDTILQNIDLVLKFTHHLIQIKNEEFYVMYPTIITHLLQWIQYLELQEQVISILQTIIINFRIHNIYMDQNLQCDIYTNIEESLNKLLIILFESKSNFESASNICAYNRYASCLKLLQEMLKMQHLFEKIEEKLNFSSLQSIFHSLNLIDIKDLNNLQNISSLYIEALCFLSDLVAKNSMWMSLYSEVLNQKHLYNILAFMIYKGPKNMKLKVLNLITKFSLQSTVMLSDCLEEIEQLSVIAVKNVRHTNSIETDIRPMCSFSQQEQLQIFIDQLENMFNSNEIKNIKTSNIIKLYQYKISGLNQTEVWLKQSLDNASEELTHLNHRIISLNSESSQLNQMLLENHLAIDELSMENTELKKKLDNITEQFSTTSNDFVKLSRNYESKRQIIQEQDMMIKNLENQLEQLRIESNEIKTNLLDQLQNEKTENRIQVTKFEQQLMDKQNIISEKTEEIDCKTSFIKNLENCILEKDKDIVELRKQLQEEHRIREMISQMLAVTSNKTQTDK